VTTSTDSADAEPGTSDVEPSNGASRSAPRRPASRATPTRKPPAVAQAEPAAKPVGTRSTPASRASQAKAGQSATQTKASPESATPAAPAKASPAKTGARKTTPTATPRTVAPSKTGPAKATPATDASPAPAEIDAAASKAAPTRKPPVRKAPASTKPPVRKAPASAKAAAASATVATQAEKPADASEASAASASEAKVAETTAAAAAVENATKPATAEDAATSASAAAASVQAEVAPPRAAPATKAAGSSSSTKTARPSAPTAAGVETVLVIQGLTKRFDDKVAVDDIDLAVTSGTIFGIVGPNGAGKTTTLSMVTGLLRPDAGRVSVHGADVWSDPVVAKRNMGVLPDRLRLFDRLTGSQLLYYSGVLRGLSAETVKARTADLAAAFGLDDALDRLVTDYSAGMTKKVALAAAMIHSPRLLVLDEPFESVDPVSAANVIEILQNYVAAGGTVVLSSHSMDLIQRICDSVAIVVSGKVLASGTMDEVRGGQTLEDRFVELAGGRRSAEGMEWLHSFSD
jgi:ABC-type multidrug transport system ATPase subunit